MAKIKFTCAYCGKEGTKHISQYHWSIRQGLNQYCNRKCSGLGRRTNETKEEKKVYKQWYDLFIRASLTDDERDLMSLQKLVLFHLDYRSNPDKYRKWRQQRMSAHVEYCRQPEYKVYKKKYDERYKAQLHYGGYWEAAIILKNLEKSIPSRLAYKQNKFYNKSTTKRKRLWQKMLKQNKSLQQKI